MINKQCSDYKTRFCCRKKESASWGAWEDWSQCSKSCGGGTQFTTRRCKEPPSNSNGKTCFGNWKDVVDGKDRMMIYKKLTRPCNQKDCPSTIEVKTAFTSASNVILSLQWMQ